MVETPSSPSIDDVGQTSRHVVVVGAGLAGLTAAHELLEQGAAVTIIDKGRSVGGRLATRRIGDATLDHGAQFFTVRGESFRAVVAEAIAERVVEVWCHGFASEDGYPRYRGTHGMNSFAKWLAQRVTTSGGRILTNERATAIVAGSSQWRVDLEGGSDLLADEVLLTAPVPQSLELLDDGAVELEPTLRDQLASITYKPTLALMVTLDGPSGLTPPGGVQRTEDDLFTFVADNHLKGVSSAPCMTFHVNGDVSTTRWDDDVATVIADLLDEARPFLGDAAPIDVQLKKWRYAGPRIPHPDPCVLLSQEPGLLVIAGDAFAGPKVEGAFNSGLAAGRLIASG